MTAQDVIIFHGSNKTDIEEFVPVRTSYEINDPSGHGNRAAVYGTHDGIWSMFFAIVDRPRAGGSIRNGVMYFHNRAGDPLAVYNFSVNQDVLPNKPWIAGALYFLPRATFEQIPIMPGVLTNEWGSEVAVEPLAKLQLQPEDFPFLSQIGGHDDGQIMRAGSLQQAVVEAVTAATAHDKGFIMTLAWSDELAGQVDEFLALLPEIMPDAVMELTVANDGKTARLYMELPPALRHVFAQALADRIEY